MINQNRYEASANVKQGISNVFTFLSIKDVIFIYLVSLNKYPETKKNKGT